MEKRNLYIVVAVIVVAALVLVFGNLTGKATYTCVDSDGGDEPNTPGIVSYGKTEYVDYCYARSGDNVEKFLAEYFCLDQVTTNRYLCEGSCKTGTNGASYCEGTADLQSDK